MEYYDFPDEKIQWTKLYQKPSSSGKSTVIKRQLMVRPHFPPVYRECQRPDLNTISEVVVIVRDVWKVGDLVDWWADNCYWSARITKILGDGKARIDLPQPPLGEGSSYEVSCSDLRPSLDWSPNDGWTVPIPEREGCARLIKPVNQGGLVKSIAHSVDEVRKDAQTTAEGSTDFNASFSSHVSASSLPPIEISERLAKRPFGPPACQEIRTLEKKMGFDVLDAGNGKSSYSDSVSSSHVRDATAEMAGTAAEKDSCQNSGSSKKARNDGTIPLNSLCSDTIEAAILDLEELVNRVKWIKGILQMRNNPPLNALRPSWKFLEHCSSSSPK
ncbi:uncharacterized protein LOC116142434 isoform X1 [Pistacia vera]|uniref:uncharacterized protein LOC116133466 n=1 Tax=Pistacia vera TaxID=55513 RepID=UPI001262F282|nr:uncharacterized protein LOC116133466 [Pistacia vera]XP_031283710.1 uncharacterized protein LOC116142434 isoform X1 [Pistacia vera]